MQQETKTKRKTWGKKLQANHVLCGRAFDLNVRSGSIHRFKNSTYLCFNITKTNSRQHEIPCFFLSQKIGHLRRSWPPPVHLSLTTLYIFHQDHPLLRGVMEFSCSVEGKRINQYKNVHFNSTWNNYSKTFALWCVFPLRTCNS